MKFFCWQTAIKTDKKTIYGFELKTSTLKNTKLKPIKPTDLLKLLKKLVPKKFIISRSKHMLDGLVFRTALVASPAHDLSLCSNC